MKTLKTLLAGISIISLASCTVYETPVAAPPPQQTVVYTPAPAPAPAPAPVYTQPTGGVNGANEPAPAPAMAPAPEGGVNGANAPVQQPAYSQPVTVQSFYDELAPYGNWVNYGAYGYVWIPNAGPEFQPYATAGHWVFTSYGWTWVSEYSWGWAPFHYGRWNYDAVYGWFWIPDTQWGPAWVQWRSCNGYYGWAPMGYGYGWNNYGAYNPPYTQWTFCQRQYMTNVNVYNYYEPRERCQGYINNSTVITRAHYDNDSHINYAAGPDENEVAQSTGSPITPVRIAPATGPGATSNGNAGLVMYRPTVSKVAAPAPGNNNTPIQPAPAKVAQLTEVKPVTQRTTTLTKPTTPANSNPSEQKMEPNHQNSGSQPEQQQHMQPQQQQPAEHMQPTEQQHVQPMQQQPAVQHEQPVQQQQPAVQHAQQPQQQKQQQPQQKQQKQSKGSSPQKMQPVKPAKKADEK